MTIKRDEIEKADLVVNRSVKDKLLLTPLKTCSKMKFLRNEDLILPGNKQILENLRRRARARNLASCIKAHRFRRPVLARRHRRFCLKESAGKKTFLISSLPESKISSRFEG